MKKWTIAFVNYKTSMYLKWQIKSFYEFNNPEEFQLIIVDNSRPHEKAELEKITKVYNEKHHNIDIIYYTPKEESASGQHGEAMTIALKKADSEYFLANDPDFFWVKKNILNWMASYLDKGLVAIGASYPMGVGGGNRNFPCAYGCAHPLALIKDLDFTAESSKEKWEESLRIYSGLDYSYDVGWKIRHQISSEDNNENFVSFDQKDVKELANKIGIHSFEVISKEYSVNNEVVAFHLFRGSFTDKVNGNKDNNKKLSSKLKSIRSKMGKYFYNYLKDGKPKKIITLRNLLFFIKSKIPLLKKIKKQKFPLTVVVKKQNIKIFGLALLKIVTRSGNKTDYILYNFVGFMVAHKEIIKKDKLINTKVKFLGITIVKITEKIIN